MSKKGIDVSVHNGKINWDKVKADGIEFAIIRVGYGSDIASQTDKQALYNAQECDRLGIPYGLYLYSNAISVSKAHSEAQHMLRIARQTNPTLGLWYDMEDADGYKVKHNFAPKQHKEELTNFCKIFMEDLKEAGYDNVGVYANADYFKNILDIEELRRHGKIWLAHWNISEPSIPCNIWQHTSKGKVNGINGNVDLDILYDDIKVEQKYYDVPDFTLIESLNKIGVDSSYNNRKKIATGNGIEDYKGTAEQNLKLLDMLQKGILKR
ncbi:MAG: glycoside hydrolase family 25 protein [Bacteroidales bacterium]|nr:glycoside hydrolase family 25 protein [Lachnoclostridium sp.]MCM1385265.1 glycoside hydrolase family 25 protein [Lachnoclostridium sp.]MCM1466149.1 glycoside hydrolase family 25 protein [Bacteroidales bacterium]